MQTSLPKIPPFIKTWSVDLAVSGCFIIKIAEKENSVWKKKEEKKTQTNIYFAFVVAKMEIECT